MIEQSILGDVGFTLNSYVPTLLITVAGHQSYSGFTNNDPWQIAVYLDNMSTPVGVIGGAGLGTETPLLVVPVRGVTAGDHTLRVTWAGSQYISFSNDTTIVQALYK